MTRTQRQARQVVLQVCLGHRCARDGRLLYTAARRHIEAHHLEERITVELTGCSGLCTDGPNLHARTQDEQGGASSRLVASRATLAQLPGLIDHLLKLP